MSDQDQSQPMTAEQPSNDQPQSAQSENAQAQNAGANAAASGQVNTGKFHEYSAQQKRYMMAIYILFIAGFIFGGLMSIVGVILAYIKRNDMFGTVYASHVSYVIRTFWISLVSLIVSFILAFVIIGDFTIPNFTMLDFTMPKFTILDFIMPNFTMLFTFIWIIMLFIFLWIIVRITFGFVKCIDGKPV